MNKVTNLGTNLQFGEELIHTLPFIHAIKKCDFSNSYFVQLICAKMQVKITFIR